MNHAVAVDLGASSGRFAFGTLENGRIQFEVIEQIAHEAVEQGPRLEWDLPALRGLCERAVEYGSARGAQTLGIDSWGVDHGFLDRNGQLLGSPVCYRDPSHLRAFAELAPQRPWLYRTTGIQHQPFNTICQLKARLAEDPRLAERASSWMILPDLLGYLLGGSPNHELTQASTTQLLGLDNQWSTEAFSLIGWPIPTLAPALPGTLDAEIAPGLRLARVGSHDTASAVAGFGHLDAHTAFVNVGTWSLAGTVLDHALATEEAERLGYTNERTVSGKVRFLKNIPGFYVINRLHQELGVSRTVPEWLSSAVRTDTRLDLLDDRFFNPDSMVDACLELVSTKPETEDAWAGLALYSLAATVASCIPELSRLTGRRLTTFRVGGGGSRSGAFCQALADETGLQVVAGPSEVTVLGNLAVQFLASGALSGWEEANQVLAASAETVTYSPVNSR